MKTSDWLVIGAMCILLSSLLYLVQGEWTESMQWFCISMLALLIAFDHRS